MSSGDDIGPPAGVPALQFARWSSLVEPPFWQALADRKLDQMKLSEDPVPLSAAYRAAPESKATEVRFVLTADAFSLGAAPSPEHAVAPGELLVTNTAAAFKSLDKAKLLSKAAERIWDDICSGAALAEPALLNRFVTIAYADLKTWCFYYWVCFPALSIAASAAPRLMETPQLARDHFGPELASVNRALSSRPAHLCGQPVFVLALPGAVHNGQTLTELSPLALASWRSSELAAAMSTTPTRAYICVIDACALPASPGWVVRNVLCALAKSYRLPTVSIFCYKHAPGTEDVIGHSLILRVALPAVNGTPGYIPKTPKAVGWEMDLQGKPRPRKIDMGPVMDPRRLAESAVDLNLKLMRWRLMPSLQVDVISQTKCLLLGAGTLGCQVSRSLLGWGVRKISLVDSGRVSFSNPVRQSLYTFEDCTQGGRPKAAAAADHLREIFPGVDATGYNLSIPMPGHPISQAAVSKVTIDVQQLEALIKSHDVVFLLTDTRESRWLPSLLAAEHGKLALTVALGFDSFLVMRHGVSPAHYDPGPWDGLVKPETPGCEQQDQGAAADADSVHLGCYFCNDVVAPTNSMRDRTLDQQCTVTRPGLAAISGSLCVELLINLCHHPNKALASAAAATSSNTKSPLGSVPHQVRGFVSDFSNMILAAKPFNCCTACSNTVRQEYRDRGVTFVLEALQKPAYLEELTGLAELQRRAAEADLDDMSWDSFDED
eukprot:COSAG01_NODE_5603_length_4152_cov_6.246237_1_plen_719_part_00